MVKLIKVTKSEWYAHRNEGYRVYYDNLHREWPNHPVYEITDAGDSLFNYMLEVVPPMRWRGINSYFETFCVGEQSTDVGGRGVYVQWARLGRGSEARYFSREVFPNGEDTWITPNMIEEADAELQPGANGSA
jgi:hypothetical protein